MAIEKCEECGCPQLSDLHHSFGVHYKNCSCANKNKRGRRRKVSLRNWRDQLAKTLKIYRSNVDYAKEQLLEARDCIKNTCLDEVYECRWDCYIVLG